MYKLLKNNHLYNSFRTQLKSYNVVKILANITVDQLKIGGNTTNISSILLDINNDN